MHENYSIEVNDDFVEIYGDLTIEETFDFLNFFDKKGYKSVIIGCENSTLRMMKKDKNEVIETQLVIDLKEELVLYKDLLKHEQESHENSKHKLKNVERLLKLRMSEEHDLYKKLQEEKLNLLKLQCVEKMENNPEVKKIVNSLDYVWHFDEKMNVIKHTNDIPDCCSTPEKQEMYEKLVQLKNEFGQIPIPSPMDYYINPDPTKD